MITALRSRHNRELIDWCKQEAARYAATIQLRVLFILKDAFYGKHSTQRMFPPWRRPIPAEPPGKVTQSVALD